MLDINLIRQNPEKVKEGVAKKGVKPSLVDDFLKFDKEWREITKKFDDLKAEQNGLNEKLAKERDEVLINKAKELKESASAVGERKKILDEERQKIFQMFPNLPFENVPVGRDERENKILREVGKKKRFSFEPKDYLTITEKLEIIDVKKSGEVAGSRFAYLKGDLVLLEFALVKLALEFLSRKGFLPVMPPVMIRPEVYEGMGRLAGDQKEERYFLEKDNLYLVGSSEHTMGPIHMNDVLDEKSLPRRYVAFSTCFRREAGSYGKDTKGILRVHQFDKVEMFSFTKSDSSDDEHKFLLSMQEKLMSFLDLPYRVVEICTGDMGFTDAKQYDIETWLPGQESEDGKGRGRYRETNSCSNTTDFQARGVNVKSKNRDGKTDYAHMLNATGFAIGRVLIAIIENYQKEDGSIDVPKALRKYVGKSVIKK